MSRRLAAFLALGVTVLLVGATIAMNVPLHEWFAHSVIGLWLLCVAGVGTAVAINRPGNVIAWLLLGTALCISGGLFVEAYASYAFELDRANLPLASIAAWLTLWVTIPGFGAFILVFLLFPSGQPLSPRWRVLGWLAVVATGIQVVLQAFKQGRIDNIPSVANPLGIWRLEDAGFVKNLSETMLGVVVVAALASLIIRFFRSQGTERQQMKWFVAGATAFPICFISVQILDGLLEMPEPDYAGFLINMAGLLAIPLSMGVAILRYRLYEIDTILNRAVVYGLLTAALLVCYLLIVVGLGGALEPVTRDSDIAVAASTLAVAALFGPLRRRIQMFIDRRFYRARYDAESALQEFGARLRQQVDLEVVRGDVLGVVSTTLQPSHASLWLNGSEMQ
ncbi:MAG: hypothetical protein ABR505_02985 [Actinomycetota bacterium]